MTIQQTRIEAPPSLDGDPGEVRERLLQWVMPIYALLAKHHQEPSTTLLTLLVVLEEICRDDAYERAILIYELGLAIGQGRLAFDAAAKKP